MSTLEEIEMQISYLDGCSKLLGRKEIKELPNILWEDEKIEKLWGLRVEDFPYDKVTSIQHETGMLLGKITIFASGNKAVIDQVDKQQARNIYEYVRARITSTKEHVSFQEQPKHHPLKMFLLVN